MRRPRRQLHYLVGATAVGRTLVSRLSGHASTDLSAQPAGYTRSGGRSAAGQLASACSRRHKST
eukprot:3399460-Prymnesium_polylepis.1